MPQFRFLYPEKSSHLNRLPFSFLNVETIQERIAYVLKDSGIDQPTLAGHAGATKGLVNQWLNGPAQSISYRHALNIERRLGYRVHWLITGEGPIKTSSDPKPEMADPFTAHLRHLFQGLTPRQRDEYLRNLAQMVAENQRMYRELLDAQIPPEEVVAATPRPAGAHQSRERKPVSITQTKQRRKKAS